MFEVCSSKKGRNYYSVNVLSYFESSVTLYVKYNNSTIQNLSTIDNLRDALRKEVVEYAKERHNFKGLKEFVVVPNSKFMLRAQKQLSK